MLLRAKFSLKLDGRPIDPRTVRKWLLVIVLAGGCASADRDAAIVRMLEATTKPATADAINATVPQPYGALIAFTIAAAGGFALKHLTGKQKV